MVIFDKITKVKEYKWEVIISEVNSLYTNKDNKNYFIDTEGYGIRDYKPSDMPSITYNFYNWMNHYPKKNRNMDR